VFSACVSRLGGAFGGQIAPESNSIDERALFRAVGAMYQLDPDLFQAIALVESHDDPRAVSGKGAMGLMQLMPATALRFRVADPFDPVESVLGAARFLDYLRDQQDCSDIPKLLAAYNAGEGAVKRYHGIPPYAETREYVRNVLWRYLLAVPSGDSGPNHGAIHNFRKSKKAALKISVSGDEAVLDQLADLKRQRETAEEVQSADGRSATH